MTVQLDGNIGNSLTVACGRVYVCTSDRVITVRQPLRAAVAPVVTAGSTSDADRKIAVFRCTTRTS